MSATLGGLIKDYRLQKNISQLEIAFALGWKEPSRLSRIEQGRVEKPKRELVEKIMDIMHLKIEERNYLLYIGNYVPTDEDIKTMIKKVEHKIQQWPYPAEILDFTWRVVYDNENSRKIYNVKKLFGRITEEVKPNVLEILFHPKLMQDFNLKEEELHYWKEYLSQIITHFNYSQRLRTKEKFYINLIQKLMANKLFVELWQKAQTMEINDIATNYGIKRFINPKKKNSSLNFRFFVVPMYKDPRFDIEFHVPADKETAEFFEHR
jgi:transcriptional regulator with XRE-family HTH domain